MTDTTDYNIQFARIWQRAATRQEAYSLIKENLDPEVTYKKVVTRARWMRKTHGVPLKELGRSAINWSAVISAASTEE